MTMYSPAQPEVLIASGTIEQISSMYSWATFINSGAAAGTIDFGGGNIVTLGAGESLTMPYLGRPYAFTEIDGTLTTIKIIYVR
jgi:hypothetical protein